MNRDRLKENKITISLVSVLVLCLTVGWILYLLFGHQLIKAVYEGKSIEALNTLIKYQNEHPIEYYLNRADVLAYIYTIVIIIFSAWLLGICLFVKDKMFKKYLLIYLVLGTLLFFVALKKLITHHYGTFDIEDIFYGTALAPNIYRIFVPYLAFLLKSIIPKLSWLDSTRLWVFVFILSIFPLFHIYLSRWFERNICFLLTLILGYLLPISFLFYYPENFLELGIFIIGYMLIRDRKDLPLYPLIFLSTLNRESAVFLVISYFVSNVTRKEFLKVSLKSFTFLISWLIPFIGLRLIRGFKAYRSSFFTLDYNIKWIINEFLLRGSGIYHFFDFLFFLFIFIFIYIVFKKGKANSFLRKNLVTVAIVFIAVLCFGGVGEIRLFYPALPIVIPLAFYPLFGKEDNRDGEEHAKT